MARYTGPVCRVCRREGEKLYLKGNRCMGDKCSFKRRSFAPGQHGQRRPKMSDYGMQLREKQKMRKTYGMMERQFKITFSKAARMKGMSGYNLLVLLERRLDNMVYRLGFAASRRQARQLVKHGHFLINGKKVDIPSYLVKIGETISVRPKSQNLTIIKEALETAKHLERPSWLSLDIEKMSGSLVTIPTREDIPVDFKEQLIVELYSK